jgi:signal transduction histidine kinase/DNA-binding response OmpR family regulator
MQATPSGTTRSAAPAASAGAPAARPRFAHGGLLGALALALAGIGLIAGNLLALGDARRMLATDPTRGQDLLVRLVIADLVVALLFGASLAALAVIAARSRRQREREFEAEIAHGVKAEERLRAFSQGLEVTNRRLEEANVQLEEANKLKSEFLANTSHELRTPLNGMIGFLQLVLDDMCDSEEEERDFLEQALGCSRHLLGLINDVLDIAKIEAGKLSLEIEEVDVRGLFGEIYTVAHVQAAQKGLTLRTELPEGATPRVRADFGKVKQVLVNLVANSIKFTTRGSITVRASERTQLGHVLFEVIDTGIGVPTDRHRMIFEKFTQGDGSTTRKYGGTGLGLAICKNLVELMGGVIGVDSEGPGTGTRMFFSLPLWQEEDEPVIERAAEADATLEMDESSDRIEGPVGGALVLIVEDDRVFTKFLVALLHHHGYRTLCASNAETAWLLARRSRPAVVVLDYALSSAQGASLRTGWDLAERMASDTRTRHVPLVFVTGFDVLVKERLKTSAMVRPPDHLMKPVDGTVLVAKIEELVGTLPNRVVRLLMADDDPSVIAYVRKVLPEERFHLEVANNGEECLHVLRMQPQGFDLLLLDLMMPDVSGYDVLRELSLTGTSPSLPVLILTNFPEARNDEEKRLLERGLVLDVIAKSSVHENPVLLPHIIDWHLQAADELGASAHRRKEAA